MKLICLCSALLTAVLPLTAHAQISADPWFRSGTWMFTVDFGGAAFTDFQRTQARPVADEYGVGDFDRRVSARTSGSMGGSISYWIGSGWGLRGGLAWVPSSFTVWNGEAAERALLTQGTGERPQYSPLDIWMADASLVFRFPRSLGRVTPYGIAGGGVVRYHTRDATALPAEARAPFAGGDRQAASFMFGAGAAIPLQRGDLLLTFELTSRLTRSPLRAAGRGEQFEIAGIPVLIHDEPGVDGVDDVALLNHLRLSIGLTLPVR